MMFMTNYIYISISIMGIIRYRDKTTVAYIKQLFSQVAILLEADSNYFYYGINVMGFPFMHQSRRRLAWNILLAGRLKFKLKPKDFIGAFQF